MRVWPSSYATIQASSTIATEHGNAAPSVATIAYSGYRVELYGASYTNVNFLSWYGNDAAKHIWQESAAYHEIQRNVALTKRYDNCITNLIEHLMQFISQTLQDAWTSHAKHSAKSVQDVRSECADMASLTIQEWCDGGNNQTVYTEQSLLLHKRMFDIMECTKEGYDKENTFI